MRVLIKSISRNDIWRIVSIIMIVGGSFFSVEKYSIELFGSKFEFVSNFIQIIGGFLIVFPFVSNYLKSKKEISAEKNDSEIQS